MSVPSPTPQASNPVTMAELDQACATLGVEMADAEKEDYRALLGGFHDAAEALMALPDVVPAVDLARFPREHVHPPDPEANAHGAWAWRCSIKDQSTERKKPGLLAGRTVVLKDSIAVKDVPMELGTEFVKGIVPNTDATVVTRLLEAGAHVIGKAVCENLCLSATSHSAASGPVHNPFARGYCSGGSSSGCGVLVALGEADLAVGADQGGSVRIPACNCGIVGLKPTFGLVPYTGCASNEPTNDHLGPMTRTVMDNALMLQAMAGTDDIDDRSFAAPPPSRIPQYGAMLSGLKDPRDLSGVRLGIITEALTGAAVDARVRATVLRASSQLAALGATVEHVSIPQWEQGRTIWTAVSKAGGFLTKTIGAPGRRGFQLLELNEQLWPLAGQGRGERWARASAATKNVYVNGAHAARAFPLLPAKASNLSRGLRAAVDAALAGRDALLAPTLPAVAKRHCAQDARPLDQLLPLLDLTSNTCQFNLTGHPALTVPVGMLEALDEEEEEEGGGGVRLPVGLQVVGRWWAEETVYRVGYAWEQAHDWRGQ
ncbi:uncharacterized protein K452DRAFT_235635 [Aplosporella prunicola CBS 121167]|uniref:Amidase domain-containing protein n=1 Tax=Aplosporella prunicola CBS 121167 TaxID=1176127 RepID=A0A6A6B0D7_9PEZI|nr:uncharacterized protein K452DRAFT_235635 [Aplosporella prunicola CBS 121167]KAF2137642.1 hypothetical protein K452DRAFT_235635 [Aplosporella prunicola CBS 121167]